MANGAIAVTQVPGCANLAPTDEILVIYNANNVIANASLRTIQFQMLCANLQLSTSAPATSTSNCQPGTVAYDSNYLYIGIGTNVWRRIALSSF